MRSSLPEVAPLLGPEPVAADAEAIERAAAVLRTGRLVAFPTETVYGLGALATDDRAVAGIFAAKGRPSFNPLIVHVPDVEAARDLAVWTTLAEELAARFWPGPLTLVLRAKSGTAVSRLATAGLDSVALRAPAHPVARALLRAAALPVAAPSANRSEQLSPTRAEHVRALGPSVAMILDGGACRVGVESTVLDVEGDGRPVLLRAGGITRPALEAIAGALARPAEADRPRAPGQLRRHYAPRTPLRLNAETVAADEVLLAFGPRIPTGGVATANLSLSGDLVEAAARLFDALHRLDRAGARAIAVMPIPNEGLGEAINDRLLRGAALADL